MLLPIYLLVHSITTLSGINRDGRLKPYLTKSRWIAQSVHPFINMRRVFYAGVPERPLDLDDEDDEEQE
jgi:hypothetical protein